MALTGRFDYSPGSTTLVAILSRDSDGEYWNDTAGTYGGYASGCAIPLSEIDATHLPGVYAFTTSHDLGSPGYLHIAIYDTSLSGQGPVGESPNPPPYVLNNVEVGTFNPNVSEVDGITYAKAIELLIATVCNVAVPGSSQCTFMRRDGATPSIIIGYGVTDGVRNSSVIQ